MLIFYLILFLPQRKREKQAKAMRDAIKVGDDVVTIGGIVGKVLKVRMKKLLLRPAQIRTE